MPQFLLSILIHITELEERGNYSLSLTIQVDDAVALERQS